MQQSTGMQTETSTSTRDCKSVLPSRKKVLYVTVCLRPVRDFYVPVPPDVHCRSQIPEKLKPAGFYIGPVCDSTVPIPRLRPFSPVTSSSALLHVSHDPRLFHVWTALHELSFVSTPLLNHIPRWHSRGCTYRIWSMRQGFCLPPTVTNKGSHPVTCLRVASRLLNVSVLTWTFYCLVVTHGFNVYADGLGLDIDVVDLFCTLLRYAARTHSDHDTITKRYKYTKFWRQGELFNS